MPGRTEWCGSAALTARRVACLCSACFGPVVKLARMRCGASEQGSTAAAPARSVAGAGHQHPRPQRARTRTVRLRAATDPGSYAFTGEWASGAGWPANDGALVFSQFSGCSQAQVRVSAYAASLQQADTTGVAGGPAEEQQWRVLRFQTPDRASQQSIAKVGLRGPGARPRMLADSLGFQYTKSLASSGAQRPSAAVCAAAAAGPPEWRCAVAALVGAHPGLRGALQPGAGLRALLVGLGGGALALYLSAHFPGLDITAAELDPVVARAAVEAMGFPADRSALPPLLRARSGRALPPWRHALHPWPLP